MQAQLELLSLSLSLTYTHTHTHTHTTHKTPPPRTNSHPHSPRRPAAHTRHTSATHTPHQTQTETPAPQPQSGRLHSVQCSGPPAVPPASEGAACFTRSGQYPALLSRAASAGSSHPPHPNVARGLGGRAGGRG